MSTFLDRLRHTLHMRSLGAMGIAGALIIGVPVLHWRGETHRRFRRVEAQLESELTTARCCGVPTDMETRLRIIGVAEHYQVTRGFLNRRETYLKVLLEERDDLPPPR